MCLLAFFECLANKDDDLVNFFNEDDDELGVGTEGVFLEEGTSLAGLLEFVAAVVVLDDDDDDLASLLDGLCND